MKMYCLVPILLLTSCAITHSPSAQQDSLRLSTWELRHTEGEVVMLTLGIRGRLDVHAGCTMLGQSSVIWPKGSRFDVARRVVVLPSGKVYALNREVTLGGPAVTTLDHVLVSWGQEKACPSPWILAG
jgi:hypothetical protein